MSTEQRGKLWLERVCVNGARVSSRLFPTKREAMAWGCEEKTALGKAGAPLGAGPSKTSLGEAMELFAERATRYKVCDP